CAGACLFRAWGNGRGNSPARANPLCRARGAHARACVPLFRSSPRGAPLECACPHRCARTIVRPCPTLPPPHRPTSSPGGYRGAPVASVLGAAAPPAFPSPGGPPPWDVPPTLAISPPSLFPPLEEVAAALIRLTADGVLPHHVLDTLVRLLAGFALAAVAGV